VEERGDRGDPGNDERSPGVPEDDRGARGPRLGDYRAGRRAAVGLHPGDGRGPGGEGTVRPEGRGERRVGRPEGDQPRGAPPATGRLRRGDPGEPPAESGRPGGGGGGGCDLRGLREGTARGGGGGGG